MEVLSIDKYTLRYKGYNSLKTSNTASAGSKK